MKHFTIHEHYFIPRAAFSDDINIFPVQDRVLIIKTLLKRQRFHFKGPSAHKLYPI